MGLEYHINIHLTFKSENNQTYEKMRNKKKIVEVSSKNKKNKKYLKFLNCNSIVYTELNTFYFESEENYNKWSEKSIVAFNRFLIQHFRSKINRYEIHKTKYVGDWKTLTIATLKIDKF